MDFLKIQGEPQKEFERIAQILFDNYLIETYDAKYRLIEIEFYWNTSNHTDKSTYKRNHVELKAGDWFFHYSGVDIALDDEKTGGYGGILIRGIYDVENKIRTKGPMVCAMKLFSGTSAFSQSIKTQIISHKFNKSQMEIRKRKNLGNNAKENGFDKQFYAFMIDPTE